MAHPRAIETTSAAKAAAKSLQSRMNELGIEMKLGQAYEAMASSLGYANWAHMNVSLAKADTSAKRPSTATIDDCFELRADAVNMCAHGLGLHPVTFIDVVQVTKWANNRLTSDQLTVEQMKHLVLEWAKKGDEQAVYTDFFSDWLTDIAKERSL